MHFILMEVFHDDAVADPCYKRVTVNAKIVGSIPTSGYELLFINILISSLK